MIFFIYYSQITSINKRLAPNLRRLKIRWFGSMLNLGSVNKLFECDILSSLTHFSLEARMAGPYVLGNLLSMLSKQCSYFFDVHWSVTPAVTLSETSNILSNTFQQFKGSTPIELELTLEKDDYSIRALTPPKLDRHLSVYSYLRNNVVHG
jgi:hypothetical protein